MIKKIQKLLKLSENLKPRESLKNHPEYEILVKITAFLPNNSTQLRRLWHVKNKMYAIPICVMCDNEAVWNREKGGSYRECCSNKCATLNPNRMNKIKQTNLKRYGGISPINDPTVQDKIKQTNIKKYGVSHAWESDIIRNKIKDTMIKKYGVPYALKSPQVQRKAKQTNLKKYNVDNPRKSKKIQDRIKQTNIEKYGAHYTQSHLSKETLLLLENKEWLFQEYKINKRSMESIAKQLLCDPSTIKLRLIKFNINVNHHYKKSIGETELANYLIQNNINVVCNSRTIIYPHEIDIYVPDFNIAIEYNGTYWHSELNGKHKLYHLNKTQQCEEKNITLIHVSDTEWNTKRNVVLSKINNKLRINIKTIYARKCIIQTISTTETNNFIAANHIQGKRNATINMGLFYKNMLVMVMTISKHKKYQYEIIRMCTVFNTVVVGGASKMLNFFIQQYHPQTILSFSNKTWGNSSVYKQLGFHQMPDTPPNYKYFYRKDNTIKLYSRLQFQKHKLKNKLKTFDPQLTEWENMKLNGYDRIWDCGHEKWIWNK